jgi:hypothetical protein
MGIVKRHKKVDFNNKLQILKTQCTVLYIVTNIFYVHVSIQLNLYIKATEGNLKRWSL